MKIPRLPFQVKGDLLGYLISLESLKNVPFEIKRVYLIYGINIQDVRGKHAHRKLRQVLLCASGRCTIMLEDAHEKQHVDLTRPDQGIVIDPMVWHEMYDFSPDCVLMVVADDFFDEKDYIRDYHEFCRAVGK